MLVEILNSWISKANLILKFVIGHALLYSSLFTYSKIFLMKFHGTICMDLDSVGAAAPTDFCKSSFCTLNFHTKLPLSLVLWGKSENLHPQFWNSKKQQHSLRLLKIQNHIWRPDNRMVLHLGKVVTNKSLGQFLLC